MRTSERKIRGLRYVLHEWGDPTAPPVLLLHGWMDTGRSYRYLVEHLNGPQPRWRFVAPDWRGHGRSQWAPEMVYRYADYLADLDPLVDELSPNAPVTIVGHSMGGNIATLFAAVRAERVRAVVNVEGFGLRDQGAAEVAGQLRAWLSDLKRAGTRRPYADLDGIVQRVRELSPRIAAPRAREIAEDWSEQGEDGQWRLRADPALRWAMSDIFRVDEAKAIWREIRAPVFWVQAAQSENIARHGLSAANLAERRAAFTNLAGMQCIDDCGHMAHWDQPEQLATAIRPFLAEYAQP